MKRLHLLIGGPAVSPAGAPPPLRKLMARARQEDAAPDPGYSAALARLFGLEAETLPALQLAAEGIDPGADAWFRADPVHLLAGMHSLTLFDDRHLGLRAEETEALLATLNRHFAGEIEFLAPHPFRWYARFRAPVGSSAVPLDQVAGGAIAPESLAGPEARELQRLNLEIQMLLHDHPVNAARETRQEATVNSLWFWGGGRFRHPSATFARVFADDFPARALAAAAGIPVAGLSTAPEFPVGETLVALPHAMENSAAAWPRAVLSSLQRYRLDEARLTLPGPAGGHYLATPWRALAFWRNGGPTPQSV